jgi:hypothetical protein
VVQGTQKMRLGWVSPLGAHRAQSSRSSLLNIIPRFRVNDPEIVGAFLILNNSL